MPRVWHPLVIGLSLVVVAEAIAWRVPYVPAPTLVTPVSAWLRDAPGPGPVAFVPQPEDRAATPLMLGTLVHGRPIVNGYSGQRPAFAGAVAGALATFPSADAIWTLHDLGVRFVITTRGRPRDVVAAGPPGERGRQRRRLGHLRTRRPGDAARRSGDAGVGQCAAPGRAGVRTRRGESIRRVLGWGRDDGLGRYRGDRCAGRRRDRRPPAAVAVGRGPRPHPLPGAGLARDRVMGGALLRGARHVSHLHR